MKLADGRALAALRWRGPVHMIEGSLVALAHDTRQVVLVSASALTCEVVCSVVTGREDWPPTIDTRVRIPVERHAVDIVGGCSFALGENDDVWIAMNGPGFATRLVEGAEVETARAIRVALGGGAPALFSVGSDGKALLFERRQRPTFAADAELLLRFKWSKSMQFSLFTLDDGCALLVYVHEEPLTIHRAGESGRCVKLRPDLVPSGPRNYLIARRGGAWLVSGQQMGGPIHVHKLVGPKLEPEGAPYVLPGTPYDRPLAVCAIGEDIAVLTGGAAFAVTITDGVTSRRTDGVVGYSFGNMDAMSMTADPSGTALWVGLERGPQLGLARVDLLGAGDPRLDAPFYTERDPREGMVSAPARPPRPPPFEPSLASYARNVRIRHLLRSISAVHYPSCGVEHGLTRERGKAKLWSMNGSGNHHLVMWNDEAIVALAFDRYYAPIPKKELLAGLPPAGQPFADALLRMKLPRPTGAEWVVRVDGKDRFGRASSEARELHGYAAPVDEARDRWVEHYSVSEAHFALAERLADAREGHVLTQEEVDVILASPAEIDASEEGVALGRKHFADAGIVWPGAEGVRAPTAAKALALEVIDAAARGDIEAVRALAARGANLDAKSRPGQVQEPLFRSGGATALTVATLRRDEAMVAALLEAGANPAIAPRAYTLVNLAARAGSRALAQRFIAVGGTPDVTFFYSAIEGGDADVIALALERGVAERTSPYWVEKLDAALAGSPELRERFRREVGI